MAHETTPLGTPEIPASHNHATTSSRPEMEASFPPSALGSGWWLLTVVLLLPFAYALCFLFPRGDDFDEVTRAMFLFDLPGGVYEVGREWLTWSGRYTYHFLAVFLGKAGELRSVYGMTCGVIAAFYGVGLFCLAREAGVRRSSAFFCGFLGTLTVLCCYQSLDNLYLLTDALTMGLMQGMTLLFLWTLCNLWRALPADALRRRRRAIIVGVLTVGLFEHSALAALTGGATACVLAWRGIHAARRAGGMALEAARQRLRHFVVLEIWIFGAMLFSFLSPGNQVRRAARHIEGEVLWRQISDALNEWHNCAFWFFSSLWPWAVLLLVLLLRGLRGGIKRNYTPDTAIRFTGLWLSVFAAAAYLALSVLLTLLQALSDVPLNSAPKLSAGLAMFAAYAFGFVLWGLLDAFPIVDRVLARLPRATKHAAVLAPLLAIFAASPNWCATAVNAANGSMLLLGQQLQGRYDLLRSIGDAAQPPDALPKFGLIGEVYRPGARKRAVDPSLPMTAVQRSIPSAVFPVQAGDPLCPTPTTWPNLWVAWMLGLGGVYAVQPSPVAAIDQARELPPDSASSLKVPEALRQAGIDAAWLVQAQAAPSKDTAQTTATFDNYWIVLHLAQERRNERIAVLRVNAPDWRRLLPLPAQQAFATSLLNSRRLPADADAHLGETAAWSAQRLVFNMKDWQSGEFCAVPVSPAHTKPEGLFIGLDAGPLYRLDKF